MTQRDEVMSVEHETEAKQKDKHQMKEDHSSQAIEQDLLLEKNEAEDYRSDWLEIQTRFIDDPRDAVENADELVSDLMDTITSALASQHDSLERQWGEGSEPSTEELRRSMMRYRSFFNRLLTLESSETESR